VTDASLANLIAYSAQVLIVVAAGALGAVIVRLPIARARVAYWRLIIAACLALPLIAQPVDDIVFTAEPAGKAASLSSVGGVAEGPAETRVSVAAMVGSLLLAGAVARGAWLGLGILALARLRRRSDPAVLHDDVEVLRRAVAPETTVRWHSGLAQPVAFGWMRPTVLLPQKVGSLPLDAQRAVVCHELLHVARRDWVWMLGEEAVRCIFWFHPAIWFALTKLQLSREELVDEEVVRITGVRQPYVRALAMFAGEPAAFAAATPFIRRRHLVSRIRQLSEDHTMSRLRIACGSVVLVAVMVASGWAAVSALPLRTDRTTLLRVPKPTGLAPVSLEPVEPGSWSLLNPVPAVQDAAAAPAKEQMDEMAKKTRELAAAAAQMRAAGDAQRVTLHVTGQSGSPDAATYRVAPVYPEAAKGHGVEAVVTVRVTVGTAGEVTNVETVRARLTTERDITDPAFWASQPSRLFGQAAEDAVRQWRFEPTGSTRRFEVPVSFGEQDKMVFVPIGRGGPGGVQVANGTAGAASDAPRATSAQGDKPARIRVGGAIRQPHQVSKVAPVYPPAAEAAKIQGVVVLELVIGTDGSVQQATVLRSIPLLDQAALDAVGRWRYEPTLLNGAPVEVIAVVTINFTLPEP
jgi:TonB family protein